MDPRLNFEAFLKVVKLFQRINKHALPPDHVPYIRAFQPSPLPVSTVPFVSFNSVTGLVFVSGNESHSTNRNSASRESHRRSRRELDRVTILR
jgi:hypothetical protein